jgi:beta-glucosidase
MPDHFISFPKNFIWGSATSAFQIEGSPLADGAAKSNWYEWTHTPGRIKNGDTADVAIDHYRLYKNDVAIMKQMGLKSYRFSISWPRIIPERGKVNQKGLDFYRSLIQELLSAGIMPNITLFHWEVPVWAEGGWENRETALAFQEYAEVLFKAFGNEVPFWATMNEPSIVSGHGFLQAYFPPGKKDKKLFAKAVHHLNLGHALAVQSFRKMNLKGQIGLVLAIFPFKSRDGNPEDEKYAQKMFDLHNGVFLNPSVGRPYPPFFFEFTGENQADYEKDYSLFNQPLDFLGVNHYNPSFAKYVKDLNIWENDGKPIDGMPTNELGWPVSPTALYDLLMFLWKEYRHKQMIITENGYPQLTSNHTLEELLEDDARVHYYGAYMEQAQKAIRAGVPLTGYYPWSLFDNFEWCEGNNPRFGLIHVDYKTLKRTFKKSAHWYQKVIAQNGFDLGLLPKNPNYPIYHDKPKV